MMKQFAVLSLVLCLVAGNQQLLSDEYIESINQVATTWKAGRNFHKDTPMNYIKGLLGVNITKRVSLPVRSYEEVTDLPNEFDAREKWSSCPSISEIRDQSSCGSCWAIAAVESMTDRQCIHKNEHFHYSVEDLLSCCEFCGLGCRGGDPSSAMRYWKNTGIVSGGQYGSKQGCRPYSLQKCEHHVPGPLPNCDKFHFNTPACEKKCEASYNVPYKQDLKFAKEVYGFDDVDSIMKEIYENGPVEASFEVYSDFPSYKSGVYKRTPGTKHLGGHAVRMLGWGVEDGVKYWLMANSWNEGWGDKGYFKILRGQDECGIEDDIVAGIPA